MEQSNSLMRGKRVGASDINRLIEMVISGSISSQLIKKSLLNSKAVLPIQTYGNEKEDPLQ